MRRTVVLLASMALTVLFSSVVLSTVIRPTAAQSTTKPNIVFILADDMRYDDLKYMPKTQALLGGKGMRFKNAFVSNARCCPSRATIMRGQYAHNTGVWTNNNSTGGGWKGYKRHGNEKDNVATRLRRAGYETGLFGKYLNDYSGTSVPPGWVDWFATLGGEFNYYDWDVNDNGTRRHYGTDRSDYNTDVLKRRTQHFIGASVARRKPFFAYVAPKAPHGPATPASRDMHTYDGEKAPRLPSFNEKDVSDKPPAVSSLPLLGDRKIKRIDNNQESRAESLQALDDLVKGVENKLKDAGVLNNTYIFFTSDNGWEVGEHRIGSGKGLPYEESIHMPLLVRGPGVKAGSLTSNLTLNTDFLPTFTDLAGVKTPSYVDGRSLRPVLKGKGATPWRTAVLLEYNAKSTSYYAIRTSEGSKYIVYKGGFRELYNLKTDPYELSNSYDASRPPTSLKARLKALKGCAGASCRAAENK